MNIARIDVFVRSLEEKNDNLYSIEVFRPKKGVKHLTEICSSPSEERAVDTKDNYLWHKRLWYASIRLIEHMIKTRHITRSKEWIQEPLFPGAVFRRNVWKKYANKEQIENFSELIIHNDICRSITEPVYERNRHSLTFVVRSHCFGDVVFATPRDELSPSSQKVVILVYQNSAFSVKVVHSDNAKEYICMKKVLKKRRWNTHNPHTI